jgi:hypothetical protein
MEARFRFFDAIALIGPLFWLVLGVLQPQATNTGASFHIALGETLVEESNIIFSY